MKIQRYEAATEQEAIKKAQEELGMDAIILNIKKINPKGFYRFFRSPKVEVMAAIDQEKRERQFQSEEKTVQILESKIDHLEKLLHTVVDHTSNAFQHQKPIERKYKNKILEVFHQNLLNNEVETEVIEKILEGLDDFSEKDEGNINKLVGIVYNRIIQWIGEPKALDLTEPSQIVFIGPTGVGKTTTIAKIAAHHALKEKKTLGFITADTYRIAAVDQLKTYAEILDIPIEVVYGKEELTFALQCFQDKHGVIIDTAGRSHKNPNQFNELSELLGELPNKQVYLVLSLTTKYNDLQRILQMYTAMTDYHIILTKMDETTCLGNILNIRMLTSQPFSYLTNGQNVPEDIELLNPQKIAKILLGSYEDSWIKQPDFE
ncbi:MAG: flagellar biosynthesis protein FlhF [Epulopiscium sp.]|nr:flagellar biosynthesis protein FlhF [Candidatus Epulonipiscium sp.]